MKFLLASTLFSLFKHWTKHNPSVAFNSAIGLVVLLVITLIGFLWLLSSKKKIEHAFNKANDNAFALSSQNEKLGKDINSIKNKLKNAQASISSLNSKVDSLNNCLVSKDKIISELKDSNEAKGNEINTLKHQMRLAQETAKNEDVKNLSIIDEIRQQVVFLENQLQNQTAVIEEKTAFITKLEREGEELKERATSLQRSVNGYKTSSIKAKEASDQKDALIEEQSNDLKQLQERLEQLEALASSQSSQIDTLTLQSEQYNKERDSKDEEKIELERHNLALEERIKQLESIQIEMQLELSEKETRISTMKTNLDNLQSEYYSKQKQLKETNRVLESEKAEKKVLEESFAKLQERNRFISEKSDSLQVSVNELVSENRHLIDESVKTNEKINLLIKENSGIKRENTALHDEKDKLKVEKESLRQQIQELMAEKEELSPYMYLIEAKKKQETIESAVKTARINLQDSLDSAVSILSTIKHEEVKDALEDAINSSQELVNSIDCTFEDLNNSKESIDSATKIAVEQEKTLIEQEEAERKRREEEAERKRREEEEQARKSIKDKDEFIDDDDVIEEAALPYIFYDYGLIPAEKLSIPEVYDIKKEITINARDFFSQHENELILWRRNLQEEYLMGHARFICPECKQPVKISGHKLQRGRVCYFAHFKDSDDCPYKTGTKRTKEEIERRKYSLVQESERHKRLKAAIASALEGEKSKAMGIGCVECEKRINSDIPYLNWRRPDVYAEYNGRKYVFELQLTTTFVSVIVDRDIFYRLNDYNIIWVFNFEDSKEYVNLHNLMCKDIYYANKRNVFIFDADAEERSKEQGELVLKCRWLDENDVWSSDEYVTLEMFQYDEEYHKPFIVDADKPYLEKHPEYVERREQLEHSREDFLKALIERQKQEEEHKKQEAEEQSNLQLELLNSNKCVERFLSGKKYGYQFGGRTILAPQYTSAESIREDGYAQVGFNRKIGLVRRDGKEIVPVEYKTINVINSQHGIVIATYKRVDLWLGEKHFILSSYFDEKEQTIIREEENGRAKYILQTKKYNYSYSQSYYGNHPIRRKYFDGHSNSTLFILDEENDFCIIWVNGATYLLSRNHLSTVRGNYSDIKPIGVDQFFIAKDAKTNLWGGIDLHGKVMVDFKFASLIPTETEYLLAQYTESTDYGVIDYQGREFIEPQFEALICLNSERFAFLKNHLWGICDRLGNILHEATYTYIRISSGSIMASTLESYLAKWKVEDSIPTYNEENINLCLLDDKGDIVSTEQDMGQYRILHSGDLYSILSINNKELVSYSLSYVEFVNKTIAIIKDAEGNFGLFVDEKCCFFEECRNIEYLDEYTFLFENFQGNMALGNCLGPAFNYSYCEIKAIDSDFFVATQRSHREYYNSSVSYVIIDRTGKVISAVFDQIGDFEDGFANAVYQGRKGIIDVEGKMQEKVIKDYGDYILYEKFENFYFLCKKTGVISEEYQNVDYLIDMFFVVKTRCETNVKLYSLEANKSTDNSFNNVYHLVGDLFVAIIQNSGYGYPYYNKNVCQLYRGLEPLSSERYSSVVLLNNGYIALQKSSGMGYSVKTTKWKLSKNDGTSLNDREYDSIIDANDESFKVCIDGHDGHVDLNGNFIVEKHPCDNGFVLTHCFADRGLEDANGNIILSLEEHFSSIEFEGTLIKACKDNKYALYSTVGVQITKHKFSSITYETTNRYAVVEDNIKGHIDSQGNYLETSAVPLREDGTFVFVIMEKYGLRDSAGKIIIPSDFTSINYLDRNLLVVRKASYAALYNIDGEPLTDFNYSEIFCSEDGSIHAKRNNTIGELDDQGKEIADILHFNGGYLQSSFGEYTVKSDAGEIIVPIGYSNIELLDNEGIFALWKGTKLAISNISKDRTEAIYESAKSIGNGFFVVSRTITKKIRTRHTGYGFRGNPYTYFSFSIIKEKKYGIIDGQLQIIIPCKYISISDFDDEQKLTTTNANSEKKTISLQNLKKKASHIIKLTKGTEYDVKVKTIIPIGLVVKIQGNSFVIHKKYLFKKKNEFERGEPLIVKFLGTDRNDYPIWETKMSS